MARLPVVAIIGRPNTGKSSLFNRLVRKRMAIESEVPGTTRDHIGQIVKTSSVDYVLLDTGGMGGGTDDKDFEDDVHAQSLIALQAADLILFVVDGQEDPTKNDYTVAELLRKNRKRHVPVVLVINKCDNERMKEEAQHNFHQLGVEAEIMPVSASHKIGTPELEALIVEKLLDLKFAKKEQAESSADQPRVAIIGKPNVGKSSIINALMSESQRALSPKLVSPIAGTTRDSTDTLIRWHEQEFLFVDTAGLRSRTKVEWGVESLSMLRTIQSIEDCDIAVLVLDGSEPVSKMDKKIAGMAVEAGKGLVIMLNKTDLLDKEKKAERQLDIRRSFQFCKWAPVVPCSAETREGLLKVFEHVQTAQRNRTRRLEDQDLKQFLRHSVAGQPMSSIASARKIMQDKGVPPTFLIFVKNPKIVQVSQLRYLENRLRETFALEGTPVKWITKGPKDRIKQEDFEK